MIKALNGMEVNDNLRLAVGWCTQEDFSAMQQQLVGSDAEVLFSTPSNGKVWDGMRYTSRRRMSSRSPRE